MLVLRKLNVRDALRMFSSSSTTDEDEIDVYDELVGIDGFPAMLPLIGTGASKWVFDLGDGTVLKVHHPRSDSAAEQWGNQIELECLNWASASEYQRTKLAPIVRHADDYTWAIQEQAIRCTKSHASRKQLNELAKEVFGIGDTDTRRDNCGIIDGRLVYIDYGYMPIKAE